GRLCHAAGGELEQIQFLLGHASVQTTERYIGCKQALCRAVNDGLSYASRTDNAAEAPSQSRRGCRDGYMGQLSASRLVDRNHRCAICQVHRRHSLDGISTLERTEGEME